MSIKVSGTQLAYTGVPISDTSSVIRSLQTDVLSGTISITGSTVTAGSGCTFLGQYAADNADSDSSLDTAIGFESLQECQGSNSCVAVGAFAGQTFTSPMSSVFLGCSAGRGGAGGGHVVVGSSAGSVLFGNECVLIGDRTGEQTFGNAHTMVGARTGRFCRGDHATFLGSHIGCHGLAISNGVYCGSRLDLSARDSDKLIIHPGWRLVESDRDATMWNSNAICINQTSQGDGTLFVGSVVAPDTGYLAIAGQGHSVSWTNSSTTFSGNVLTPGLQSANCGGSLSAQGSIQLRWSATGVSVLTLLSTGSFISGPAGTLLTNNLSSSALQANVADGCLTSANLPQLSWSNNGLCLYNNLTSSTLQANSWDGCLKAGNSARLGWSNSGVQLPCNLSTPSIQANMVDGCLQAANSGVQLAWSCTGVCVYNTFTTGSLVSGPYNGTLSANGSAKLAWSGNGVFISGGLSVNVSNTGPQLLCTPNSVQALSLCANLSEGVLTAANSLQLAWSPNGISVYNVLNAPGLQTTAGGGSLGSGNSVQLQWSSNGVQASGVTLSGNLLTPSLEAGLAGGSLKAGQVSVLSWSGNGLYLLGNTSLPSLHSSAVDGVLAAANAVQLGWNTRGIALLGNVTGPTLQANQWEGVLTSSNRQQLTWSQSGVTVLNNLASLSLRANMADGCLLAGNTVQLGWSSNGVVLYSNLVGGSLQTSPTGGSLLTQNVSQMAWSNAGVVLLNNLTTPTLRSTVVDGCLVANNTVQLQWTVNGVATPSLFAGPVGGYLASGNTVQMSWSAAGLSSGGWAGNSEGGMLTSQASPILQWGNASLQPQRPIAYSNTGVLLSANQNAFAWSCNGGTLFAANRPRLSWNESGGQLFAGQGAAVTWQSDGSVALAGPVTISGTSAPVPNTAQEELANGNPSTISSSLTCQGDIVTLGGGVFVLSDQRSKTNTIQRDPSTDLALVREMKAVNFNYTHCPGTRVGLLAADVQTLVPEAVKRTRIVGRRVDKSCVVVCVAEGVYHVQGGGVGKLGYCEVSCLQGLQVADVQDDIFYGSLGPGGPVTIVREVMLDGLCIDYQHLTAVHLNATRHLAQRLVNLEAELATAVGHTGRSWNKSTAVGHTDHAGEKLSTSHKFAKLEQ